MNQIEEISQDFQRGLARLGFRENDDALFLISENEFVTEPEIAFYIETAKNFKASALYLRKQVSGNYKPQAYLYDCTESGSGQLDEKGLANIQKKVWSSGEVPLLFFFFRTEIKIVNCTTHINNDYTPAHLVRDLKITGKAHRLYNEQFALKLKSGLLWEEAELANTFKFSNSAYDILIDNIRFIIDRLQSQYSDLPVELVNKIIIQAILIKYLEERIDDNGNKLLSNKFFKKYNNANSFDDVLNTQGKFVNLLEDLDHPIRGFNGNIFNWNESEKDTIKNIDLSELAILLRTDSLMVSGQQTFWRYFEFKYIPVELISRLYEEFLGVEKKDNGVYYTPSHLAKLLVDESLPLKKYDQYDLSTFKVLDPACGSGIFLVSVFKRLVQIWRLQHGMRVPEMADLKELLRKVYGVDREEQAVRLASFSLCLALCHELNPIDIINKLKFDDLREKNLIHSDFFHCTDLEKRSFDLIIGNPPFKFGGIKQYSPNWEYNGKKIKIPQGQIAIKFLTDSLPYLKPQGLSCLIIKSSGLLYNSTSEKFRTFLFSNLNVIQLLDFTALGRNKALWDNGADVATAAIFLCNEQPDFDKNILHLTFRRTRGTKERLVFEIDHYDLHFVDRPTAINNTVIWKNNLLGGGRIKSVVEKFDTTTFKEFLEETDCIVGEGFKVGSKGSLSPELIYRLKTLPTSYIREDGINLDGLDDMPLDRKFEKIPPEAVFMAPNIIIWENIGKSRLPVHLNTTSFSFQHKMVGIANPNNPGILTDIMASFRDYNEFYRFFIFVTSGQLLINKNTAILKTDLMKLPFLTKGVGKRPSEMDNKIAKDVNVYMQNFLRHGERSIAVKRIASKEFKAVLSNFGTEFSKTLNSIYGGQGKAFRLSEVVALDYSYIGAIFKYDDAQDAPKFLENPSKLAMVTLSELDISAQLSANRIIKLYPREDTVVLIKPNQYRYWISLVAYRDADKCFSDLSKMGY